jgi:PKD repeat protein
MKISFGLIIFLCVAMNSYGQFRKCATHEVDSINRVEDSDYAGRRISIEEQTRSFIANFTNEGSQRAVITIPVVFHVVYQNATENISDAAIKSQIDILNLDFRKLNSNFNQTPTVFRPAAADMEIEFCLASVNPQGAATSGITRTQTTDATFSTNDQVKFTAQGGINAWPRDKYLNIWVCDLGTGLLGYAQFPGGQANRDGVVIHYKTVGAPPANVFPGSYNRGRTATHEVGHWLNLYHIWGDDNGACDGTDEVSDTPNSGDENFGCPSFPRITCNNGPNGDMFMNFMDYMDDACATMFTNGQKARARALFSVGGFRSALLTSNVCTSNPITQNPCADTLRFPFQGTPVIYADQSNGFIAGTNSYRDSAKADKFTAVSPFTRVTGGFFKFSRAVANGNTNYQVTFRLYNSNGVGGLPGTILASTTVPIATISQHVSSGAYTQIQFPNPVIVSGNFYLGYVVNPASGVTLAVFTNTDADSNPNTAYEQFENGTWHAYTEEPVSWGISVSNQIHAIMDIPAPIASFAASDNLICKGTTVAYTSNSTGATSFQWSFNGGNPSSSSLSNPVVSYANTGTFNVSLTVIGGCSGQTDTETQANLITVTANPDVPVIQYSNGTFISSVVTGTFEWFRDDLSISGATGSTYIPTETGNYIITVTQNGCTSTSAVYKLQTLGIGHAFSGSKRLIFPNPASDQVTVQFENFQGNGIATFSFVDMNGRVVFSEQSSGMSANESIRLNVGEIPAGIYIFEIKYQDYFVRERIAIVR